MNVAIVVAAGKGTRLGSARPKQFLELRGVPIIVHTLRHFESCKQIDEVITVLPAEDTAGFQSLARQFDLKKAKQVVAGGATRAQSVRNGLNLISDAEIVAVHDGVRPLVTAEEIDKTVVAAREAGAAILVAPVSDTIKQLEESCVKTTLNRANLRRALTPQCFRFDILKRAYNELNELESTGIEITDDSLLVERLGIRVVTVAGSTSNIKITGAADLKLADLLLTTDN